MVAGTADSGDGRRALAAAGTAANVQMVPGQPTSILGVKALAQTGVSYDVIINQMKTSRTIFHSIAADVIGLRDAGVSDKVLNSMINPPTPWSAG